MKELNCDSCGFIIEKAQYAYEVKLDDGTIKHSHGGKCLSAFGAMIKRIPIKEPDWWVREIPNPVGDKLTMKELSERADKLSKQTHEMALKYMMDEPLRQQQLADIEAKMAEIEKIIAQITAHKPKDALLDISKQEGKQ